MRTRETQKGTEIETTKANLFDTSLPLLQENQPCIADATLVPSGGKPLTNNRVGACFDESILVSLGAGDGRIEFGPVHLILSVRGFKNWSEYQLT